MPIILAPRGEFAESALGLKGIRKGTFLAFSRFLELHKRVVWHATSAGEYQDILRMLGSDVCSPILAPNLPGSHITCGPLCSSERQGPLRVVFLARVSRMKNLAQAVRIIAQMPTSVIFEIWGPIDDSNYWLECKQAIASCPSHIKVRYCGAVEHEDVYETLRRYDVFFLPTLGENFGHAISEALTAGVPVVISDRTPWRNLQETGVGFDIALENTDMFLKSLKQYADMSNEELLVCRQKCVNFAAQRANRPDLIEASRNLFMTALTANRIS